MSHRTLTDDYLATAGAGGQVDAADFVQSCYRGRPLSRPLFLGADEHQQLMSDLAAVHDAIGELPGRLFGGDFAAFAQAVGFGPEATAALLRSHSDRPTRVARADLYLSEGGFRLLEFNFGSAMDGFDNATLNEAMLTRPAVRSFVDENDLVYIDTMAEVVDTILTECGVAPGAQPFMAAVDWPESFLTLEPRLHKNSEVLRKYGLDTYPCHVGQLRFADGRVWLGERPVDIIYRLFLLDDYLTDAGPALIDPVLDAVARGEVAIVTPLDTDMWGSKGVLALLSDEQHRDTLTERERAAVDRMLPWTRAVQPGPVRVDGRRVDFVAHVADRREQLVLKPMNSYGGTGIVSGRTVEPEVWRERVEAAMGGPYVVQERVDPIPEVFPVDGQPEGEIWNITWATFPMSSNAGGLWIRGDHGDIVNMSAGASGTCCFLERGAKRE